MIENLVRYALKNKMPLIMVFLGICIFGGLALSKLPINSFPDISPKLVQVFGELVLQLEELL